MEVTLEDNPKQPVLDRMIRCFNPYSNGSYFGSVTSRTIWCQHIIVSILILMEVTLEEIKMKDLQRHNLMFQSLF